MSKEGKGSGDSRRDWSARTLEECVSGGHPECRLRGGVDRELMNIVRQTSTQYSV